MSELPTPDIDEDWKEQFFPKDKVEKLDEEGELPISHMHELVENRGERMLLENFDGFRFEVDKESWMSVYDVLTVFGVRNVKLAIMT